jgi:hypothetical protein
VRKKQSLQLLKGRAYFIRRTEGLDYHPTYIQGDSVKNKQDDQEVRQTDRLKRKLTIAVGREGFAYRARPLPWQWEHVD